jgi:phage/plasmid-associated DNA primase
VKVSALQLYQTYQSWSALNGTRSMSQPIFKQKIIKHTGSQQLRTSKGLEWPATVPSLTTTSKCCSLARHCSHSYKAQHFFGSNFGVRTLRPLAYQRPMSAIEEREFERLQF